MAYTKYSLTPADNNAAPPNGAPEGMLPSAVNDTMRDMMSQIRDVGDGIRGGTYTMTAPVITGGSITGVALSGNTLTNPVITGGSINNTTVGATTRSTGAFTTLASNGATTFTAGTASTSTTTGTAVITGGLGVSGRINAANFDGIVGANTAAAGNFTTLGATGVATFSAGTVSAPAITTTGDTNTGIYFPAADTIAFTEGGVEAMRIDSSGNVGIGTSSPTVKLQISGGVAVQGAGFPSAGAGIELSYNSGTALSSLQSYDRTGSAWKDLEINALTQRFGTNSAERMRITSDGNLLIGTTTGLARINSQQRANGLDCFQALLNSTGSAITVSGSASSMTSMYMQTSSGVAGSITNSGTTTAYNTSSDYRLKENIAPMTGALNKIAQLKPCTYTWKADGSNGEGFIAHELQEICPSAVTGVKDAVNKDGSIKPQGIDTSFLVATLTAAIQEQQNLIENLTTRLNALEGK